MTETMADNIKIALSVLLLVAAVVLVVVKPS